MNALRVAATSMMFTLIVASAGVAQVEGEVGIPLGSRPDPVSIEDLEGQAFDLANIIGHKPVLLEFWATWCALCRALEPRLLELHREYGKDVEFVAVGVAVNQTKRSITRHLSSHELPFRFLYDTQGRATRAFMAPTTSYIVMLDRRGMVVYTGVGEDQDLAAGLARVVKDVERGGEGGS